MLKYLSAYKKEAFFAPLFKLLEASFELIIPLVIANIIDIGIAKGDKGYILNRGAVLVLLALTGLISALTAQYFAAKAGVGFATDLRNDLFKHIMGFSHKENDMLGKDTLITRLTNDTNQIQTGVNMFFRLVLRSPFIVFGAVFMAMRIDFKISMIFIILTIFLFFIVSFIMRLNVKAYKNVQRKLDKVFLKTDENLAGIRVIRAFAGGENEVTEFKELSKALYKEQIILTKISAFTSPITYVAVNLGIVAVLYSGALKIEAGNLSSGQVVALVNYMSQILTELIKTATLVFIISKALASKKRVEEVFEIKSELSDGKLDLGEYINNLEAENIIEFRNVSFTYPCGGKETLSDISFSLKVGESLGIIGGTGSGKTSLVNLLLRFYDIQSGSILIAGKDIRDFSLESLRDNISMVEQKVSLFKGSIKSNLLWAKKGASIKEDKLREMAALSDSLEIIEKKKLGFDEEVLQKGKNFSGGQRQRLSIARTLLKEPAVLILDDSSSALDYVTDAKLRKNIKSLNCTTISVSQRVASIKNLDKILVLDKGKIEGIGKHEELLKTSEIYKEICLSQLSKEEVFSNEA